jgi:Cupredoxin-like domain
MARGGTRTRGAGPRRPERLLFTSLVIGLFVGLPGAMLFWLPAEARADQELTVIIKNHRFEPSELRARTGEKILLKVTNEDAAPEEFESSTLNREQLIRPKHTVTIHLPALKPGRYDFYGEFNPKTATGQLIIE